MAEVSTIWERHLQSGLLGLLSFATIAMATATIQAKEDIAVVRANVANIQEQFTAKMGDRWTGADHRGYASFDALRAENLRKDVERNTERLKELTSRMDGND